MVGRFQRFTSILKRACKYTMLAALLLFAVEAYPKSISFRCDPAPAVMRAALQSGFGYLATAIAEPGAVVQVYVNREGRWLMIGIDDQMRACPVAAGVNWTFAR